MRRRWLIGLVSIALCVSMTGCSFMNLDMDTHLRAPHAGGEQNAIQNALEQHIYEQQALEPSEEAVRPTYVLKYPKMGSYRSAFIMKDINGDGAEDALAFYALSPDGSNTHIALLSKRQEKWTCLDDIEGLATEIERVNFGDLNSDGVTELFAGFSMFDTRDRRLMLYTWEDDHFVERYTDTYTSMIVGSMVEKGRDDFLLFRIQAPEEKTTVRLLSMEKDAVVEKSAVTLDGGIQQFLEYSFQDLPQGTRAVYQECLKTSGSMITELILWDGEQLKAPLYDPLENITTHSARESMLSVGDIDADGQLEWPQSFRMPGDELTSAADVTLWLSDWYAWDESENQPIKKMTNIVNNGDGFYVRVPEEWIDRITARYVSAQRCFIVMEVVDGVVGEELFRIVTVPNGEDNPFGDEGYVFLDSNDKNRFLIRYDKESSWELSMELLSGLFEMYPDNH